MTPSWADILGLSANLSPKGPPNEAQREGKTAWTCLSSGSCFEQQVLAANGLGFLGGEANGYSDRQEAMPGLLVLFFQPCVGDVADSAHRYSTVVKQLLSVVRSLSFPTRRWEALCTCPEMLMSSVSGTRRGRDAALQSGWLS